MTLYAGADVSDKATHICVMDGEGAVSCICAHHAKGVLSTGVNKSDPHDAEGVAQPARTGWFKAVRIQQDDTHLARAQFRIHEQQIKSRRTSRLPVRAAARAQPELSLRESDLRLQVQ